MLQGMAEKDAPASADTQKKSTLLEIDEDFLTSWKSIKVAEDGDFECGTPPSKKKGFKFDKLDMDFSLDGDFSKLPSFKLDMGDLDFSSPARKKENVMERTDREADVKSKAKKDLFTLDFNFNGPGGFDLDMGFSKEKKSEKSKECDKDNSSIQDVSKASRKELASNNNQSNNRDLGTVNILESGATSECINGAGTSNPGKSDGGHFSHTDCMENPSINTATETAGKKTRSSQCSPDKTLRGRSEQRDCGGQVDENLVPELYAESVSGGDQVPMTTSEVHPHDAELHADVAMGCEDNSKMTDLRTFSDTSATSAKDCFSRDEKCHLESDSESKVVERGDLSMTKLFEENVAIQNSEITNTLGKMNKVEKDMPKHDSLPQSTILSLRRSMISLKENASALGLSKSADKSQDMRARHPTLKNLSTLCGKLAGIANHPGTKSIAKVFEGAEDKRIHMSLISELKNSLQAQSGSEVSPHKTPNAFSCRYEVTPQKTPHKDVSTNITKNANHKSLPTVTAVVLDLGISAKMTPTLKQNTSPMSGMHKPCNNTSPEIPAGQSTAPHNKALIAKHSDVRIQLNLTSKMKHIVGSDKVAAVSPSLKRKTLEETNTESVILNPLKQLRGSSCDREVQLAPEMLEKRKVSGTHEVREVKQRNYLDHCTSELVILEATETNVEVPLLIENDSNIEKAEACSKELDELCNMLKKKNDEAKEILVRAVVNNNLLLMLNHPIYEEKIQKLQRLLSDLALAERNF